MLEIIMRILSAAVTIFLVFFLVSYLYALVEDVKKKLRGITKIDYTHYNVAYFLVFWFLNILLIYATINLIVFFAIRV
ncbi:hypothetical protein [Leptotrichia sp. oral taxon 223]|uniref:hypothetical protein n=1 Tax=Leptotrichia sp. oral taxon 223 TaxID=712363 RepID=UPI0015BAFD28|nr:hypothetical protein [Leptotrichia sp. oral taxon 223]NWO18855.1 hypothetical protein [Leptotrichia sp. oral taxon 223]